MAFGLGELRLAPKDFWAMTPRELAAAAGQRADAIVLPPSGSRLRDLMQRYPDKEFDHG